MKVCYVTHTFSMNCVYTGVDTYLHQLIEEMSRWEQVSVYSGEHIKAGILGRESESTFDGVPVTRITTDYWAFKKKMGSAFGQSAWDKLVRGRFKAYLLRTQPDIVHIQHLLGLSDTLPQVLDELGIPFFFTVSDFYSVCPRVFLLKADMMLCQDQGEATSCAACCAGWGKRMWPRNKEKRRQWHKERLRVWQKTFESARRIFIGSSRAKEIFCAGKPSLKQKVEVFPPGIKEQNGIGKVKEASEKRARPLRLGYFGGIQREKGVDLLCQAVAQQSRKSISLDLFGYPRGYKNRLRLMKYRLQPNITFHGSYQRWRLPELLARVDMVVVPSLAPETFCFVAHEALSAGIPLLVSDRGALPEAVAHGGKGMIFSAEDPGSLSKTLGALIADPERLEEFSVGGRNLQTPAQHAQYMRDCYLEVNQQEGRLTAKERTY